MHFVDRTGMTGLVAAGQSEDAHARATLLAAASGERGWI